MKFLSHKGRSVWKGMFLVKPKKSDVSDFFDRNLVFSKKDLNNMYLVYNGKKYYNLKIDLKMLGFKAGQFVLTKKIGSKIHKKDLKKRKKK